MITRFFCQPLSLKEPHDLFGQEICCSRFSFFRESEFDWAGRCG